MAADAVFEFTPDPNSSAQARLLACEWASGLDHDLVFALELVVSELVTNAIRHGVAPITMTLSDTDEGIRVEVHDHGYGRPTPRVASARAPGGRGLRLISRLSSSWGIDSTPPVGGKSVWALVPVPAMRTQTAGR